MRPNGALLLNEGKIEKKPLSPSLGSVWCVDVQCCFNDPILTKFKKRKPSRPKKNTPPLPLPPPSRINLLSCCCCCCLFASIDRLDFASASTYKTNKKEHLSVLVVLFSLCFPFVSWYYLYRRECTLMYTSPMCTPPNNPFVERLLLPLHLYPNSSEKKTKKNVVGSQPPLSNIPFVL